eukprot:3381657-Alexandrium_andersonii.AAC.1
MAAVNAKRQELGYFEGAEGRSRAQKFGKTLRAKCAMHISCEANEMAPFFQAITEAQRHMEDLQAGQDIAKSWPAYLEAILRPCRWIDGIG